MYAYIRHIPLAVEIGHF